MNPASGDEPQVAPGGGERAERPNFLTAARFTDFDLPPEILAGVDQAGFEYCTPIQTQAIPVAMKGLDIAGQAQTGTGKTTAFLLPLMNRLLKNKPLAPDLPRALIITPTRELALQIHEDALILAGATALRQALIIGGVEYKEQAELLGTAPEIVIGTPGRLIDYMKQGVFKTAGVEVAVVDEADRLLDMGFIKDLKYILGRLPSYSQRQTMLFSATLDERVLELTYEFMNPPQFITAEPDKSAKLQIEQELYHVGREEKLSLLMGLLRREPHRRVIIFANTKSGVEWLAKKLAANNFQAEGITGDLPQPKRLKLMESFKDNRLQILVATDVASRGIHVDDVSHVYNYDLPQDAENYIHRIGRTARAGRDGKAVSFGCEDYVFHLEAIENLLGEKIPVFWAESDWFQEDQGGEVRLKDRGDRRKQPAGGPRGRESRAGRAGGVRGEAHAREAHAREAHAREAPARGGVSARGPARSQRPGGIFGLAPRLPGAPIADERRSLSWAATPPPEEPPLAAGEPERTAEEREDGRRRRRRRRGRRGREAAAPYADRPPADRPDGPASPGGPEPPLADPGPPEPAIEIKIQKEPEAVAGNARPRGRRGRPPKASLLRPAPEQPPAELPAEQSPAEPPQAEQRPKPGRPRAVRTAPEPPADRPPARRGRPPKVKPAADSPPLPAEPAAAKRRGRPRFNKAAEDKEPEAGRRRSTKPAAEGPPKRPGRPRTKKEPSEAEASDR